MRTFFLFLLLFLPALPAAAGDTGAQDSCAPCTAFDRVNTLVRDGRIGRTEARREIAALLPEIRNWYYEHGGKDYAEKEWVFPLKGYGPGAVGGGKRHGYAAGRYDYYDGNRHTGHPSFDIFIRDRNRDERDDRTGEHVPVLSVTGGVVVARETGWEKGSSLRGGKYLWIYDPSDDALVYYAHNRELAVAPGDIVKPGDVIARVGRSGYNAAKRRSPTHLHLTFLRIAGGRLRPEDVYPKLAAARRVGE